MSEPKLLLAFTCNERPRPKGSLTGRSPKGTTHVQMRESVDPEGVFRTAVARAAWLASRGAPAFVGHYSQLEPFVARAGGPLFSQGVAVRTGMIFRFPRKPGHKLDAPCDVITEKNRALAVGDVEKLVRNVHDALMDAGVLADDHQVAVTAAMKCFADEDCMEVPGVDVEVWSA